MKESEIRPEALFNQFLVLAEQDAERLFGGVRYDRINCPACDLGDTLFVFRKLGFDYETCRSCETLFANPRPGPDAFRRYYREAPSIKFWATHFYEQTETARRERIFAPRAHNVLEKIRKCQSRPSGATGIGWVGDIGSGYGVFCEEIRKVAPEVMVFAIEPSPELARICQRKGLAVVPKFVEDAVLNDLPVRPKEHGTFTSFELLEHVQNPLRFLNSCRNLLSPGDLFIFTTLNGLGLDILVLWEKSKSVHPPHHINFFNPLSIKVLLERAGFQLLEVSTPGKLDVDILESSLGNILSDRFWSSFLKQLGQDGREDFQQFVANHNLSSHMMVVAQCR